MPLSGGETGCRSSIILPYLQDSQFDCWYNLVMKFPVFTDLGGETWRILRFADENDKRWSAFNPSISYSPKEGYAILFRSSNYFFDPKTTDVVATVGARLINNIWMAKLSSDWQIIEETMTKIDFSESGITFLRGAEDARLYWRDDGWEFTACLREPQVPLPRIGKFRLTSNKAKLIDVFNDGELYDVEKNWMTTYDKNPNFDYVYGPTSVYMNGIGVKQVREMKDSIEDIRGGSPLWDIGNSEYLAIVHESDITSQSVYSPRMFGYAEVVIRRYYHRFAKYNINGKLIGVSPKFKFDGVRIEFAAGLVVSGDDVVISYGYKDVASYLAKISLKTVMEMIEDV